MTQTRAVPTEMIQTGVDSHQEGQRGRPDSQEASAHGVAGDSDFFHHPLNYTWGIHNTNLFFMAVGLLVLALVLVMRPPTDADAIWKTSLNLVHGFTILTLCLPRTLGSTLALVLAISYGPLVASAVHSHSVSLAGGDPPHDGMGSSLLRVLHRHVQAERWEPAG